MRVLSVRELTLYIKGMLERDRLLQNVWVKGEISNFKLHTPSGHLYFTLKDEASCLKAVMFRSRVAQIRFRPEHGMKVILRGAVGLYERDGAYQIYVEEMQPDGLGAVHLALEQLKEKLAKEGLFDSERKRELPVLPKIVGVATSMTGAAVRDILKVALRRYPNLNVVIAPCAVQGEAAPREVARAIRQLNEVPDMDVIIVGRGGGSREELWAFNDEAVVRAIAASRVPVVSAVGHETDVTLADMAADLRAPTPSAAAEIVVPAKGELVAAVAELKARLNNATQNSLRNKRRISELLAASPSLINPYHRINQERIYTDQLRNNLTQAVTALVNDKKAVVNILAGKLDALSPLKVLARGYSICQTTEGQLVLDASQVKLEDEILVALSRGNLRCTVKEART